MAIAQRTFTIDELKKFNGQNGAPMYVAYQGRVIDVTGSRLWRGGMHMMRHAAGTDLSAEMSRAPHDAAVLDRFPQVGVLVPAGAPAAAGPVPGAEPMPGAEPAPLAEPAAGPLPAWLERFLDRRPFFRRHPHPMTVHFPIVFMMFAPIFSIVFLITGARGFEITALNCLAAGLLFCLVVIPTGFLTWWINYGAAPLRPVTIKIFVSILMFVDGLVVLLWRLHDPEILTRPGLPGILYLVLVCLLLPMVVVVAWYGATLTFPLRRAKGETQGDARRGERAKGAAS